MVQNWGEENLYYLADNPWSCSCHNIRTIQVRTNHSTAAGHVTPVLTSDWLQEFLLKYSNLIADAKAMQCSECECSVLLLDFKEMCTRDRADGMIWVGCVLYTILYYCTAL